MSRSGQIAVVIAAALLGLAVGYLAMTSLADDELYPVDPIELNPGSTSPGTPNTSLPVEDPTTTSLPTPTTRIEDGGGTGGTSDDGGDPDDSGGDDDDDDGDEDDDDGDD